MGHRPYPSVKRALNQFDRHVDEACGQRDHETPTPLAVARPSVAPQNLKRTLADALAGLRRPANPPAGEYRLSTRAVDNRQRARP
ncbi:hypothetical protein [Streptomyces sp. NPDC085596]|uniref:hypothetical protein n=1 Tax=Streptomyces sp. NPDC085596 TaxID=3365731 RepID=UPI0037D49DD4